VTTARRRHAGDRDDADERVLVADFPDSADAVLARHEYFGDHDVEGAAREFLEPGR